MATLMIPVKNTVEKLKLPYFVKQLQLHPFHVLTNSKLPIFMATSAGFLALSFIAKLHEFDYIKSFDYSLIANFLFEPFFSISNLNYLSINVIILSLIIIATVIMGA